MDKQELNKKLLAVIFLIVGAGIIFGSIFVIGKEEGLMRPKFQVTVLYKNVGGLIEKAPVRLAGVNVGNVSYIGFIDKKVEGRRVSVILNIFNEFKNQLDVNARFAIRTEGVLGQKLIEIDVIENGKKLDLSQPILGSDSLDVHDLAEVFARAAESFTDTSEELSKIDMKELSEIMGETALSLSLTSKGINHILEELQYITKKSRRVLDRIEQRIIDGNLFKVF